MSDDSPKRFEMIENFCQQGVRRVAKNIIDLPVFRIGEYRVTFENYTLITQLSFTTEPTGLRAVGQTRFCSARCGYCDINLCLSLGLLTSMRQSLCVRVGKTIVSDVFVKLVKLFLQTPLVFENISLSQPRKKETSKLLR